MRNNGGSSRIFTSATSPPLSAKWNGSDARRAQITPEVKRVSDLIVRAKHKIIIRAKLIVLSNSHSITFGIGRRQSIAALPF
jgi:hypothetical protein